MKDNGELYKDLREYTVAKLIDNKEVKVIGTHGYGLTICANNEESFEFKKVQVLEYLKGTQHIHLKAKDRDVEIIVGELTICSREVDTLTERKRVISGMETIIKSFKTAKVLVDVSKEKFLKNKELNYKLWDYYRS